MDQTENRGPLIIGFVIAFIVISVVIVSLRFWVRYRCNAGLWWDDYVALIALLSVTASNCTRFWFVPDGLGQHISQVSDDQVTNFFKDLYADMLLYNFAVAFTKLSAVCFYYRTFTSKILHRCLIVFGGAIMIWLIGSSFAVVFQCSPIHGFWDHNVESTCIEFSDYILAQAVPNIAWDVIVLALPVPSLWKLQTSLSNKLALIGIFLIGYFVTVVSIYRAVTILRINPASHPDFTWNFVEPNLWSSIEQSMALICVCLPFFGGVLRKLISHVSSSRPFSTLIKSVHFSSSTRTQSTAVSGDSRRRSRAKSLTGIHSQGDSMVHLRNDSMGQELSSLHKKSDPELGISESEWPSPPPPMPPPPPPVPRKDTVKKDGRGMRRPSTDK